MLKAFSFSGSQFRVALIRILILTIVVSFVAAVQIKIKQAKAFDLSAIPPCFDIHGQGKGIPFNGVNNSGIVNFEKVGLNPQDLYEACAVDPDGVSDFQVQGWAWDDNLGWISFYCPAGAGAKNETIGCSGSYTGGYGVTINRVTGKFQGYAWSDNAGWISFGCNGGVNVNGVTHLPTACGGVNYNVMVEVTDPQCQGYVYHGDLTLAGHACPSHSDASGGYDLTTAWSDNVGWFDLDGMIIPWYSLTDQIADPQVTLYKTGTLLDPSQLDKRNAPFANNTDSYTLKATIKDKSGKVVDSSEGRYIVKVTPDWQDSVKLDQTQPATTLTINNSLCSDSHGAVNKPCGDLANTPGTGDYSGTILSKAPTSNMNGLDKDNNGTVDFSYENFILPQTMALPSNKVQDNTLILNDVKISVYDNVAKACVYGLDLVTCSGKSNPPTYSGAGDHSLKFVPKTEVTSLTDPSGNDKFINISSGSPFLFPMTISGPDNVTFNSGIDGVDPSSSNYYFQFDSNCDGILTLTFPPGDVYNDFLATSCSTFSAGIGVKKDAKGNPLTIPSSIAGLYMYSVVNDVSNGVKYFSNKLPQVTGTLAVTPVVILRGNVYSTGATALTTNIQQVVHSLGDVSTNILRDAVFRNVSNIIAGATTPAGDAILNSDSNGGFDYASQGSAITPLLFDSSSIPEPQVYYATGKVHIGGPGCTAVTWSGERTIIVIGGSVYIDCNLYIGGALTSPKPKLGIIALKDLSATADQQKLQGNVYINDSVSNIQANIFADGTLFSYDPGEGVNLTFGQPTTGEPNFIDILDQQKKLQTYQLYIEGSVASQNTVGGSATSTLVAPQGVLGNGKPAASLLEARLYDLNYLRYYVGVLQRDAVTGEVICSLDYSTHIVKGDGTPWSHFDVSPGCLYPPSDGFSAQGLDQNLDLGSTYIYYDPPTPILPGFNAQVGGEVKQLVQ